MLRIFLLSLFVIPGFLHANDTLWLHQNWTFAQQDSQLWRSAEVPGTVHQDLLRHQLIPHPYIGSQEQEVQWIENQVWIYRSSFRLSKEDLQKEHQLVFEGLDTYAAVRLNDSLLFEADNMFRKWELDVSDLLREHENTIEISFFPPTDQHSRRMDGPPYHLTAGNDAGEEKVSVYTRKAPFQFGWDWGPRLVSCGIWKPVYLIQWEEARFDRVQIFTPSLSEQEARVEIRAELDLHSQSSVNCRIRDASSGRVLASQKLDHEGPFTLTFSIEDPKRWWIPPYGEPQLYRWQLELLDGERVLQGQPLQYGLRTIELVQETDSIGRSYYFKLNGKPIFAKGANYIPMDALHPHFSRKEYEPLLKAAREAGMNMIRVWGGGVYPDNAFYELCDELGILVWQDLMFACAMYPADSAFLENVKAEVQYQYERLQKHPSLALWCGNNEVHVAWHNWGWQQQFEISPADSLQMWRDYEILFLEAFPGILGRDPSIPYVHTSPLSNWGTPENFHHGSMHYWGVWHGKQPLSNYARRVGRFMSEYGFQSFPDERTVRYFAPADTSFYLGSEAVKWHQKSYIGNGEILRQMIPLFGEPADFSDFLYKSQLTQLEGMRTAIRHHRRRKGHCMGTLYWQLNDCWPGPSWSSIDYFGRWKALHYHLKELYADVLIVPESRQDSLFCTIVSDLPRALSANLRIESYDLQGNKLLEINFPVNLTESSPAAAPALYLPEEIHRYDPEDLVLLMQVFSEKEMLAKTFHYLAPPKTLRLSKPGFRTQIDRKRRVLYLTTDVFAKDVFLKTRKEVFFEENYFDLLPGQTKAIPYRGELSDPLDVEIRHLNGGY